MGANCEILNLLQAGSYASAIGFRASRFGRSLSAFIDEDPLADLPITAVVE